MKKTLFLLLTALSVSAVSHADNHIGVVNFSTCVSDSKLGKQEQTSFEALKKQMSSLLEETEKQLTDISSKFNDPEYMDGLSPVAEGELKNKFQTLNEEMNRYQNQYYQVLQQANMRIIQNVSTSIASASEKIAKDQKYNMIINKDAFFYYSPDLEVTNLVIAEMDNGFETASPAPAAKQEG